MAGCLLNFHVKEFLRRTHAHACQIFPEFTQVMINTDTLLTSKSVLDQETCQCLLPLAIDQSPLQSLCARHFQGALNAGTGTEELVYILVLAMREETDADYWWTHDALDEWRQIVSWPGFRNSKT